ncbi:ABC transporter permease, partial [Streptomyces sp. NPDC054841]
MTATPDDCLARNDWICGEYLSTRSEILREAVLQHLQLTFVSVGLGLLLAVPLAVAGRGWGRGPRPGHGLASILYTNPARAQFSQQEPLCGQS